LELVGILPYETLLFFKKSFYIWLLFTERNFNEVLQEEEEEDSNQ
jgi:hypothetical protein